MLTYIFGVTLGLLLVVAALKLALSLFQNPGLLRGSIRSRVQPERLPLFLLACVAAVVYTLATFGNLRADDPVFPQVPNILVWLVAASQLLYVVGKYLRSRQRR